MGGNGGQQITTGGLLGPIVGNIAAALRKPKDPFNPRDAPRLDAIAAQQQADVQARIDAAIDAGGTPTAEDLGFLQAITDFRVSQARQFIEQLRIFPAAFQEIGLPIGTTPEQAIAIFQQRLDLTVGVQLPPGDRELLTALVNFLRLGIGAQAPITIGPGATVDPGFGRTAPTRFPGGVPTGARLPGAQRPAPSPPPAAETGLGAIIACLVGSFGPGAASPSFLSQLGALLSGIFSPRPTGGTRQMPFVTTPGFAPSTGTFDFGGFGGIIESGLNLARNIFAPSASVQPIVRDPSGGFRPQFPAQQAGFGALLPAVRRLAPAVGAGFAGSAFEELLFGSGGASTQDQTAAFTDPVPGACRPKAHVKTNPCTGKGVWFVPRGRPLVFSGDMSACKRVDRVAKRLDKARPKRRHHHHTKRRPR